MKYLIIALLIGSGFSLFAEEKDCVVKGMHCNGCKEMVEGKICDEAKYSTCEIKIKDSKKELGSMKLITKDQGAKIDEKELGKVIDDAGYKLDKCETPKHSKKG